MIAPARPLRRFGWMAAVAVVVVIAMALVPTWRLNARAQDALRAALPDLRCERWAIKTASARLLFSGSEYLTGSIEAPAPCRAEIEQRVTTTGRFVPALCNSVERCWKARVDGAEVTLTFHPGWTHYRYERLSK